ncbi:conserved hypothetical protein [Trichinella spiralis]|uniref:hypothetical protein n=1 Tax=Trichinella spiralis TaxID=6334 RepID=UPI0001EFC6F2|nr:conserved hypothetical protein [Trichinella spiralis]
MEGKFLEVSSRVKSLSILPGALQFARLRWLRVAEKQFSRLLTVRCRKIAPSRTAIGPWSRVQAISIKRKSSTPLIGQFYPTALEPGGSVPPGHRSRPPSRRRRRPDAGATTKQA